MATTITAYTTFQGARARVVRGTIGTAIGLVVICKEPLLRITVFVNDATPANLVDLFVARFDPTDQTRFGGTDGTVGQGFPVLGYVTHTLYLRENDVLTAKAAADRDVAFFLSPEGSAN